MESMTEQQHIAAIVSLLAASTLRGASPGKNTAVRLHLEALLEKRHLLDANLAETLERILTDWKIFACSCIRPTTQSTRDILNADQAPLLH